MGRFDRRKEGGRNGGQAQCRFRRGLLLLLRLRLRLRLGRWQRRPTRLIFSAFEGGAQNPEATLCFSLARNIALVETILDLD
jgi:hypothetical protein